MKRHTPRPGQVVEIRGRTLDFSLWPVRRGTGGWVTNSRIFVADPWPIIRRVIEADCTQSARPAALAFYEQSKDFYSASQIAHVSAAKPLLLYYSFLNLAKALILVRGLRASLNSAKHGLSEQFAAGSTAPKGARLDAYQSIHATHNMFDDYLNVVTGSPLSATTQYPLLGLMRQIVTGHRLFTNAHRAATEYFISIDELEILHNGIDALWLRLAISEGDLRRLNLGQSEFLSRSRLSGSWRLVASPSSNADGRIWLEQVNTVRYVQSWIGEAVPKAISSFRHHVWEVAMGGAPYRSYFLYAPPPSEQTLVLPQMLSIYAVMYYFSSITRYRPHHFDAMLEGDFGPYVEGFLHDQPGQLLFLMASEFAKRDVCKAALV